MSSPEKPVERAEPVWPVVDYSRVDRVDVCLLGQDCFSLVRKTKGWDVVQHGWGDSPEADQAKVNSLLGALSQGKAIRYMGALSEKNPGSYGLQSPDIRISTGGGQELTIAIGAESPSGEGYFAVNSQEKGAFSFDKDFVRQCEFSARHYFNPFLITGHPDKISSISLGRGALSYGLLSVRGAILSFHFPHR